MVFIFLSLRLPSFFLLLKCCIVVSGGKRNNGITSLCARFWYNGWGVFSPLGLAPASSNLIVDTYNVNASVGGGRGLALRVPVYSSSTSSGETRYKRVRVTVRACSSRRLCKLCACVPYCIDRYLRWSATVTATTSSP